MDTDYLAKNDWWSRVDVGAPDDCWLWKQSPGGHGYGQTWDGTTVLLAHRVAWVLTHGPIADGMTVDHRCRVRMCCNPKHLRLKTNVANATDNGMLTKTHCPRGHEYAGDNLMVYTNWRTGRRCRKCRACQKISNDARKVKT